MDTASIVETIRDAQETFSRLYRAAHSVSCDDPDCPGAHIFNKPSGPTNTNRAAPPHKKALLLVLLGIVDNIGECLDLLRILVSTRDDPSRPDHLTQPATSWDAVSSGPLRPEGTTIGTGGPLREPPVPSLYYDQWARSPAVSPPAYTNFCHSCPQSFPRAPAPSPVSQAWEATAPNVGGLIPEDQERASRVVQEKPHQIGTLTEPFLPALRTPELSEGPPCRHLCPPGGNVSDHQQLRGHSASRVDSDGDSDGDSEGGEGLENGPDSHLGGVVEPM